MSIIVAFLISIIDKSEGLTHIISSAQFLSWFGAIEQQMERAHEASFNAYVDQLTQYSHQCSEITTCVEDALSHLDSLSQHHQSVSQTTMALHDACQELMQSQQALSQYLSDVSSRMRHFTDLESIAHKLSSPSLSVTSDQFTHVLDKLDECIAYLTQHRHYKVDNI